MKECMLYWNKIYSIFYKLIFNKIYMDKLKNNKKRKKKQKKINIITYRDISMKI